MGLFSSGRFLSFQSLRALTRDNSHLWLSHPSQRSQTASLGCVTEPAAGTIRTARALLVIAALIVAAEATVFVVLAALDVRDTPAERMASSIGVAVLLAGYGIGQLVAMTMLFKGRAGARAPLIVTQLLQVLIATNLRAEPQLAWAVAIPAVIVLVILLSPPVSAVLDDDPV